MCRRIMVIQGGVGKHLARMTEAVMTQHLSFENLKERHDF
jgi:hypothetical protein